MWTQQLTDQAKVVFQYDTAGDEDKLAVFQQLWYIFYQSVWSLPLSSETTCWKSTWSLEMVDYKLKTTIFVLQQIQGFMLTMTKTTLGQTETGQAFFNRQFLRIICEDQTNQRTIQGLQMDDMLDQTIVCRFNLPYAEALKKASVIYLFDIFTHQDRTTWI